MKFLSDLGSCCRPPVATAAEEVITSHVNVPLLPSSTCDVKRNVKSSDTHWRPGLSVIIEDGVVSCDVREKRTVQSHDHEKMRVAKSNVKGRSMANMDRSSNKYNNRNSYHRNVESMSMVIPPPFSATPFTF